MGGDGEREGGCVAGGEYTNIIKGMSCYYSYRDEGETKVG